MPSGNPRGGVERGCRKRTHPVGGLCRQQVRAKELGGAGVATGGLMEWGGSQDRSGHRVVTNS